MSKFQAVANLPTVRRTIPILLLAILAGCRGNNETKQPSGQAVVDYAPRIGIAVSTSARNCVAIQNATLQPGSPITLVTPSSPQSFAEAQITGRSASPCPITQDVNPAMNSYDIKPPSGSLQKLTPMIAVVGPASQFSMENVSVLANLDQDRTSETFTACGADDGVHLAAWKGRPLTGTPIWKGYYYEAGNPGTLPACAANAR